MNNDYLSHHGIKGQKWGVRRYQNADGSLTNAGRRRLERQDLRWVKKKGSKIERKVERAVKPTFDSYIRNELGRKYSARLKSGRISKNYVNAYNQQLASLMNQAVGDIPAPSGRVIRFVAKRGDIGVYTALADPDYNMDAIKRGVYSSGRIAYKKEGVQVV